MRSLTTGFVIVWSCSAVMKSSGAPAGLLAADALAGDALLVAGAGVGGVRGRVQALRPAQFGEQRAHVGVVSVHQRAVGAEHVTGELGLAQRLPIDEQR